MTGWVGKLFRRTVVVCSYFRVFDMLCCSKGFLLV